MRLLLVCHAAPLGGGTSLSPAARARAAELGRLLPRPRAASCSPSPYAVQTAEALGLAAAIVDALRDAGDEPAEALLTRVGGWLAAHEAERGTRTAVTHVAVIRAAVLVALEADARASTSIDVAPCSVTELGFRDGRWHVARVNWEPALLHIPRRRGRRRGAPSNP